MFQTFVAALGIFAGLSVVGAADTKYYDGSLEKKDYGVFIGACLQVLFVTSMLTLLVLYIFLDEILALTGLPPYFVVGASVVASSSFVIKLRLGQWMVRKNARNYGVLQVSQSMMDMALSLILVVVLLLASEGRIGAQIVTVAIFSIIALYLLKRDNLLKVFSWSRIYIKQILHFGVPLVPHLAGLFMIKSVDRFFINTELGLEQAGVYMVAVQISLALAIVFDAINKAYVPWLFERLARNVMKEKEQIVRYTYIYFVVVLLVAFLSFPIAPWLVTFIAGEKYSQSAEVIGWLIVGQAFGGMYFMVTNYIFYSKRTWLLSLATITSGLINVVLLVALVRLWGIYGAAVAFCASMAVRFLLTWWAAQACHPMPWFSFR
jgi:O-antigen/teichoic acid export membrane protein